MTNPAPPITRESPSFPPGTISGSFGDVQVFKYLSDQHIAAGRIPNKTRTTKTWQIQDYQDLTLHKSITNTCLSQTRLFTLRNWCITIIPPYVPAKSKALKNISGSSRDSTNGGIRVKRYGKGLL